MRLINHNGKRYQLEIRNEKLWIEIENSGGSKISKEMPTENKVNTIDDDIIELAKEFIEQSVIFKM